MHFIHRIRIIPIITKILVLGMLFASTVFAQKTTGSLSGALKAGIPAPDFFLQDFSGKTFTLSSHKSKGVVLWFTNLCSGCQSKMTEMEKIKKRFEKKGIEVIAISQLGEDRETVENTIREKKLSFRFLYDPYGEATILYSGKYVAGACPLENIFFVGKDSRITFTGHYPGMDTAELTYQVNQLRQGKTP